MTTILRIAILAGLTSNALAAQGGVAGEWMVTLHEQFGPSIQRLVLAASGETLSGTLGRRKIEGTVKDGSIEFKLENASVKGMLAGDELKGEAVFSDRTVKWTAVRIPPRPAVSRTHDFEPTEFQRYFSSAIKPVLRINPGDAVRTWAVDAGGRDKEVSHAQAEETRRPVPSMSKAWCRTIRSSSGSRRSGPIATGPEAAARSCARPSNRGRSAT